MRKHLLLALFAMINTLNAFAFEPGDYIYTSSERFKVLGENMVQNSDFANGLTEGGWCAESVGSYVSSTVWQVVENAGPENENVVASQRADADEPTRLPTMSLKTGPSIRALNNTTDKATC